MLSRDAVVPLLPAVRHDPIASFIHLPATFYSRLVLIFFDADGDVVRYVDVVSLGVVL